MLRLLIRLVDKVQFEFQSSWLGKLSFIKKAQNADQNSEKSKHTNFIKDGQRFLTPAFRRDGVGIQTMLRICVMFLAKQTNATYVHLPFLELAHQKIDPQGSTLTSAEWAAKWEQFFNFGVNEVSIADLTNKMGIVTLAKHLSFKDRQFGDPHDAQRYLLPKVIERIRNQDNGLYVFDLGLCRQPRECKLFLDAEFIKNLQEKFEDSDYKPDEIFFEQQFLNIAIHIRRGDVWDAYKAGSKRRMFTNKLVSQDYYVNLLDRLQDFFHKSSKPIRFHIFSDGEPDNFDQFEFTDGDSAILKFESGKVIKNIQFHLRRNTLDTLYHMIKAPILVPGKSTFSVVAALLNTSFIFYDDQIREFYQYTLIAKYMEKNPKFILLDQMHAQGAQIKNSIDRSGLFD